MGLSVKLKKASHSSSESVYDGWLSCVLSGVLKQRECREKVFQIPTCKQGIFILEQIV
jgi:hypothetical protein